MGDENGFYSVDEIRKRLSISTLVFWQYRPIAEATLGELARNGLRRIELLESPEQFDMADARSMRFIGDMCRPCGVEIAAYHAHLTSFSDVDSEPKRRERVDRCRRQIDTMLELGGVLWGSHARVPNPIVAQSYQELGRHVEGTATTITVENFVMEGTWVEDRIARGRSTGRALDGAIDGW